MIDPRSEKIVVDFVAHDGTRAHKSAWIGVNGHEDLIVSLGFNKTMERELKIFDLRNPSVTIQHDKTLNGSGVLLPFMDNDLGILYVAAKGEGTIRYYEYAEGKMNWFQSDFRSNVPGKGYGFLP